VLVAVPAIRRNPAGNAIPSHFIDMKISPSTHIRAQRNDLPSVMARRRLTSARFGIPLRLMLLKEQAVNVTGEKCKKKRGGEKTEREREKEGEGESGCDLDRDQFHRVSTGASAAVSELNSAIGGKAERKKRGEKGRAGFECFLRKRVRLARLAAIDRRAKEPN